MSAAAPGGSAGDRERTASLVRAFHDRFGLPPAFAVRAPGRVNLLGEHTDYNGLPVLPMAIDRGIRIAAAPQPTDLVRLENLDPAFPPRRYEVRHPIAPFADGDWGNYHKAAVQGLVTHLGPGPAWRGGLFAVDGDIPAGAGLSSSSALVVASALAFLAVNDVSVDAVELAELLPGAERYVGTLSGGMDQAASLLARAGHALRIDFFPLRVAPVPIPGDCAVVVCHSLVRAEKSAGARDAYNRRVIECRLACRALERGVGAAVPGGLRTMGDLVGMFPGRPLGAHVAVIEDLLPDRALSLGDVARRLGTDAGALATACAIPAGMADEFAVVRRARHVLTEADRVDRGEACLRAGNAGGFGRLMFDSHASCRDDYEISRPELDALVSIAADAGALGARLTGAGFGGCTVNLVRAADLDRFLRAIDERFYAGRLAPGDEPAGHRFVFSAAGGARVFRVA